MILDQLKNIPDGQPFVQTDRLTIYTLKSADGNDVTGFQVILDGKEKIFKVKNNDILEAFKEMEKFTGKIL
jgi:hypothetical protein